MTSRFFRWEFTRWRAPKYPVCPGSRSTSSSTPIRHKALSSTAAYLKAARASGFFLIPGFPYEQVRGKDARYIEPYVRAFKDDGSLLVWYLFEEPAGLPYQGRRGRGRLQHGPQAGPHAPSSSWITTKNTSSSTRTVTTSSATTTIPSAPRRSCTRATCWTERSGRPGPSRCGP